MCARMQPTDTTLHCVCERVCVSEYDASYNNTIELCTCTICIRTLQFCIVDTKCSVRKV